LLLCAFRLADKGKAYFQFYVSSVELLENRSLIFFSSSLLVT